MYAIPFALGFCFLTALMSCWFFYTLLLFIVPLQCSSFVSSHCKFFLSCLCYQAFFVGNFVSFLCSCLFVFFFYSRSLLFSLIVLCLLTNSTVNNFNSFFWACQVARQLKWKWWCPGSATSAYAFTAVRPWPIIFRLLQEFLLQFHLE